MTPGHLPPSTIQIRVIASRRLCRLKIFYSLLFHHCDKKYFININMHDFKTYDMFPFRIISEIFELLSKVWNVFIASLIMTYQ